MSIQFLCCPPQLQGLPAPILKANSAFFFIKSVDIVHVNLRVGVSKVWVDPGSLVDRLCDLGQMT